MQSDINTLHLYYSARDIKITTIDLDTTTTSLREAIELDLNYWKILHFR